MADPTALDVKVPNPDFMDDYDFGSSKFTPPPQAKEKGQNNKFKFVQFLAQAPPVKGIHTRKNDDPQGPFLTTAKGYMKAVIEGATLVESGYQIGQWHIGSEQYDKYDRKTNQKIEGEKRNASPAVDYFYGFGIDSKPHTVDDYEVFFQSTADRQLQVTIDWSAYDKDTQQDVASKWDDFPSVPVNPQTDAEKEMLEAFKRLYPGVDPADKKLPFIEKGGKRFWARAQVKRVISTVAESK